MDFKRIWHSLRLTLTLSGRKRAAYVKKHKLFNAMGENCMLQIRKLPLYSEQIRFHNNVRIASNVTFLTHDVVHNLLNFKYNEQTFYEKKGCIEIMDNVFVGANSTIMYDVRIGANVVIGANTVVTKDLPGNAVYAGVPARYICSFDDLVKKREAYNLVCADMDKNIYSDFTDFLWAEFDRAREESAV